jgi:hypothetical protein
MEQVHDAAASGACLLGSVGPTNHSVETGAPGLSVVSAAEPAPPTVDLFIPELAVADPNHTSEKPGFTNPVRLRVLEALPT